MASSLPIVIRRKEDRQRRLQDEARRDRREKEEQLQRLREQVEAAIVEAPHLERQIAAAQDLLEEEYSKWMAN